MTSSAQSPKAGAAAPELDKIDDAVLALLLLGRCDAYGSVWKSHDWDALLRLRDKGLLSNPRGKAKSVVLTPEGLARAGALFRAMFTKT
jgi:hypothetical protein